MLNLFRLTLHLASFDKHLNYGLLTGKDGGARHTFVAFAAFGRGNPFGSLAGETAVTPDEGTGRKLQFAPPGNVGGIAEGTDHGDASPFIGLGQRMCLHLNLNTE